MYREPLSIWQWVAVITTGLVIITIFFVVWANIGVITRELNGKAQLREAEWNRQIAVEEARAKKDSATLEAEAEIERAKGVAGANQIIADGLKGNEEYLRYLWITNLKSEGQVIYVPTEAGLPILEAGKR